MQDYTKATCENQEYCSFQRISRLDQLKISLPVTA